MQIQDLEEEVSGDNDSLKRARQELEKLNQNIDERKAELEALKPQVGKQFSFNKIEILFLIIIWT